MRKTLFTTLLATLLAGGIYAQNTEPKRTVLLALGPNEEIHYNEYFAAQHLRNNRFICVVKNTQEKTLTLVVNGKRIQTVKGDYLDVFYFDPTKENGYGYAYELAGREFINVCGKVLPNVSGSPYNFRMTKDGRFAFEYYYDEDYYLYIDGENVGPYQQIESFALLENGEYSCYYVDQNHSRHLIVNGVEKSMEAFNADYFLPDIYVTGDGSYAAKFKNRGIVGSFVAINENIYGPFKDVRSLKISGKDRFAFEYEQEDTGKWLYHVNGKGNASKRAFEGVSASDEEAFWWAYSGYHEGDIEVFSPDGKVLFYSNFSFPFVVIGGNEVGHSPALNAWYSEKNRGFGWSAVEGRELVVYEYKL
jgi:hypothetical protein